MTLNNIVPDCEFLDDGEDRYRDVIELGSVPPLPEAARAEADKVRRYASQVRIATNVDGAVRTAPRLNFKGDSDAHIVRGLIAILFAIHSSRRAAESLRIDAPNVFRRIELAKQLTPQRPNGFASMVERIRGDARRALSEEVKGGGAGHRTNKQRSIDSVQSCKEGAMTFMAEDLAVTTSSDGIRHQTIASRLRNHLQRIAGQRVPATYQELAKTLGLTSPHTIHQVTEALEHLMAEDAATGRPFIAAIAISKARGSLPAPGFFDCARRLGRFAGDEAGLEAWAFHAREFDAAVTFWTATATLARSGNEA